MSENNTQKQQIANVIKKITWLILFFVVGMSTCVIIFCLQASHVLQHETSSINKSSNKESISPLSATNSNNWLCPDTNSINQEPNAALIKYGRDLIINTAYYLGPKGRVAQLSNGMNCQNCHLEAGTKIFGNNYSAVAATYPKFRERSGKVESIFKRVNDCIERSLNGTALDTTSKEMLAIKAYITWLGKNVTKGEKPTGAGLQELHYISRAANAANGKVIYTNKCASCHAAQGQGKLNADMVSYQYPPLWGPHSYNIGAGLFRLSRFAAFVKDNMPFGANYKNTQLTDEEAWDVAAFVNSQQRPNKNIQADWPKIAAKPVDHPFGPYADNFSEQQHKYGPFEPIAEYKKLTKTK